eukprot:5033040-Lingulodinium_polyedra.AAC.1
MRRVGGNGTGGQRSSLVSSLNEKLLQERLGHGGLPIFHYAAREPELEAGNKRYAIWCQGTWFSIRQPG